MAGTVHARLDETTRRLLARLKRQRGWTDSQAIREGIRVLAERVLRLDTAAATVIGLGKFESGVSDLGANPRHLNDFGRR
jgi:hypothetical protein